MGTFYIKKPELAYVHIPRTGMGMKTIIAQWFKKHFEVNDNDDWMIDHPSLETVLSHYPSAKTLTVARNPWQRIWSFYRKISQEGYWLDWNGIELMDLKPFNEWVEDYANPEIKFDFPRWFNRFTNQVDFITYENKSVDFILKAETLKKDFDQVKDYLEFYIPIPIISHFDNYEYRSHFSTKSEKLITKMFERDIDFFKYVF